MSNMIYVASSWRNKDQPTVVSALRGLGLEVYDFKDPANAFHWSDIDPNWDRWTPQGVREALKSPLAEKAYNADYGALVKADICLLVLPCGASAHLELGMAHGMGKKTAIFLYDGDPELMYRGMEMLCNWGELHKWAEALP